LVEFGMVVDIEPETALLMMVRVSAGQVAWLKQEIEADTEDSPFERQVLMAAWDSERDRLSRTAKAALDAGVAKRAVEAAERYGEILADVLRGIFNSPELALTADQHAVLPDLLRTHLTRLERRHAALDAPVPLAT
jgi:hypothetical protein